MKILLQNSVSVQFIYPLYKQKTAMSKIQSGCASFCFVHSLVFGRWHKWEIQFVVAKRKCWANFWCFPGRTRTSAPKKLLNCLIYLGSNIGLVCFARNLIEFYQKLPAYRILRAMFEKLINMWNAICTRPLWGEAYFGQCLWQSHLNFSTSTTAHTSFIHLNATRTCSSQIWEPF